MSKKQHHHQNVTTSTRTSENTTLMANPSELLDQAHGLLIQAAELLRKDDNPMAIDIHKIVTTLVRITIKPGQQRHEKRPPFKQCIRYHNKVRPVVASCPKVNSKSFQRETSIVTSGDEQTLTEGCYSNLSSSFDDCNLNNDTDVDLKSSSNLETFTKKRKPVKKSEVTSSCKLNASRTEKYAKKKRKDTGTEKQLKVQHILNFARRAYHSFANTKFNG